MFLASCTVVEVVDQWKNFEDYTWKKKQPVSFQVQLNDTGYYYNMLVNLRVTNDYKYSNLWVNLHVTEPGGTTETRPYMLTLADHRGIWTGHNLGHIISFRIPVVKDKVFTRSGTYTFTLEQNMRDTVLKEVVSAGIKLDKQQEILK